MLYPLSYRGVWTCASFLERPAVRIQRKKRDETHMCLGGERATPELLGRVPVQGGFYCTQFPAFCQCGTRNFLKSPPIPLFRLLQSQETKDIILSCV